MRTAVVARVLTALVLVTGCGSNTEGEPGAAPDHTCAETSVPLTTIASQSDGEPELQIPQPPGWNTSDKLESPMIRFVMLNTDLTADGFSPSAVVTMETAGAGSADSEQVFAQQRELLEGQLGATGVSGNSGSQCGYPAQTISYTAPAVEAVPERQAKVLCVLAEVDGTTYLATVTVSHAAVDDPTYVKDSEAILAGFRVVPRS